MKLQICRFAIHNYRSIQDASFNLAPANIIIGKNNVGKSNIIASLQSFRNLKLNDINVKLIQRLWQLHNTGNLPNPDSDVVKLDVTYEWEDLPSTYWYLLSGLSNVGKTQVRVTYRIPEEKYNLFKDLNSPKKIIDLFDAVCEVGSPQDFIENNQRLFDNAQISKYLPTRPSNYSKSKIGLFTIDALRFPNQGRNSNQNITTTQLAPALAPAVKEQEEQLDQIRKDVDNNLQPAMKTLQGELKRFAYPQDEADSLQAVLTIDEWLQNPQIRLAKVFDDIDNFEISLDSQGLGYQNIYNIIARLDGVFSEAKERTDGAPIVIVIEEPEVFTHPQLQHVFVQKITEYVRDKGTACGIGTQLLIISHSPEVAVSALSLKFHLIIGRSHNQQTRFIDWDCIGESAGDVGKESREKLRQLVLSYNAELLFADKLICYEGDGERLILGSLMRKIDGKHKLVSILSEKVALLPVGTHFNSYRAALADLLFDQILVITDLDFPTPIKHSNKQGRGVWDFKLESSRKITGNNSNLNLLNEENRYVPDKGYPDIGPYLRELLSKGKDGIVGQSYPLVVSREMKLFQDNVIQNIETIEETPYARLLIVSEGYLPNQHFWPNTLESALVFASQDNFNKFSEKHLIKDNVSWGEHLDPGWNDVDTNLLNDSKADFAIGSLEIIDDENFEIPAYIKTGLEWLVD